MFRTKAASNHLYLDDMSDMIEKSCLDVGDFGQNPFLWISIENESCLTFSNSYYTKRSHHTQNYHRSFFSPWTMSVDSTMSHNMKHGAIITTFQLLYNEHHPNIQTHACTAMKHLIKRDWWWFQKTKVNVINTARATKDKTINPLIFI